MPSRRSRREKNRAKKIAKLNDDSCADESQDIECEERDSFHEAHEKKKACDRSTTEPILNRRRRAQRPNTGLIRKV